MPQIANITVKKNDGTTDVVYTAVAPSAGDKSPAVWRNNTIGTAAAHRPELRLQSTSNGPRTVRRLDATFSWPVTATGSDGRVTVTDKVPVTLSAAIPLGVADSDVNEAVAQAMNLFASTLFKSSVQSGFAPT
uniref:Uncharacterized protein n=1 Tax=Leviviridae sp. TaxID=2027243 RepID=A0A514D551_9VIRU|nr:MAG: hypothetical protein H2Rhizo321630_000002 [Leviviridae sp.]